MGCLIGMPGESMYLSTFMTLRKESKIQSKQINKWDKGVWWPRTDYAKLKRYTVLKGGQVVFLLSSTWIIALNKEGRPALLDLSIWQEKPQIRIFTWNLLIVQFLPFFSPVHKWAEKQDTSASHILLQSCQWMTSVEASQFDPFAM